MKVFTYDLEELTRLANQVKGQIVNHMVKEGLTSSEQAAEYLAQTVVTIAERRTYFPWFKHKDKDGSVTIFMSKLAAPVVDEDQSKE